MATSALDYAMQQVINYVGLPILILGFVGGCLNIIVFLSLKTFRQSACVFFLTVMSFVNIGQLLISLLSRILITGFSVNLTETSPSFCKFGNYCLQVCTLTSYTCMCLATVDQFLATSLRPRWQQYLIISRARYLCVTFSLLWLLHSIPTLIWYDVKESPVTGELTCMITGPGLEKYITDVYVIILTGVLPLLVTLIFGSLAYRNVRQIPYRTVPLVRRELDKQLSSMVLLQVLHNFVVITPYVSFVTVVYFIDLAVKIQIGNLLQFYLVIAEILQYFYYSSPFYIYVGVSQRFRQQLVYVISRIHVNGMNPDIQP